MRIKKVLSLAVVLAMVLTVVPMFGLTASAAESRGDYPIGLLKEIATVDCNGPTAYLTENDKSVTEAFGSDWLRYTSNVSNIRVMKGELEFQKNLTGACTAGAYNKNGLGQGKKYGIFSFTFAPQAYKDNHKMIFVLRDANKAAFTNFTFDKGSFTEFNKTLLKGDHVDILWYNNADTGYTVEYYANSEKIGEKTYSTGDTLSDIELTGEETAKGQDSNPNPKTVNAPEKVNGFGALCCITPAETTKDAAYRFPDFKLYSGDWPTSVEFKSITDPAETIEVANGETVSLPKTVQATYTVDGQEKTCDVLVTWAPADGGDLKGALKNTSAEPKEVKLTGTVEGTEKTATATAKAYYVKEYESAAVQVTDETGSAGQDKAKENAGNILATTGKITADFDITYNTLKSDGPDYWIMLANKRMVQSGDFFGTGGSVGLGVVKDDTDNEKKIKFRAWRGDGNGASGNTHFDTVEQNVKYHVTIEAANNKYGVLVTKVDDGTEAVNDNALSYRCNTDVIDTLAIWDNASDTTATVENVKVVYGELVEPAKPTAELGWDEASSSFTVNFRKGENTDAIEITPEDESGTFTGQANSVDVTGKEGAAVKTGVTNRIYSAVAVAAGGLKKSEAVKSSVYSLVVNEILNGNYTDKSNLSPARIAKASEVITKGGYLDSVTNNQIITKGQDGNTYTIQSKATDLGIGFVVVDNEIGVGNVTAAPTSSGDAKIYDTLTVADGNITLSNSENSPFTVKGQEAITLSLDSVNIEFIETLVEDTEAEGADAAQDFIPEL